MPAVLIIDPDGLTTYRGSLAGLLRANRDDPGFQRLVVDGLRRVHSDPRGHPRHVPIGGGAAPAAWLSLL